MVHSSLKKMVTYINIHFFSECMEVKNVITAVEHSRAFIDWKKEHSSYYLVHLFKMLDEANRYIWQVGFYSKEKDRITTFIVERGDVKLGPDSEVFKKEDTFIPELDITKVKKDLSDVLKIATKFQEANYKNEKPLKIMVILQNLPKSGIVYNTTYITQDLKTLNMKVSAISGKVLKHQLVSLMDFARH